MEDDDEFGDLYTDVLRPLTTSFPPKTFATKPSQSLPIDRDVNTDDDDIMFGARDSKTEFSNPNQGLGLKLNASIQEKTLIGTGVRDLNSGSNLEAPSIAGGDATELKAGGSGKVEGAKLPEKGAGGLSFMDEEDDLNIVVEEGDNKDDDFVEKDVNLFEKQENVYSAAKQNENTVDFMGAVAVGGMPPEQMIPGLSGKLENQGGPNPEDDWESDESEDDLQIVLNDNHGQMGIERMPPGDDEDDEEGEPNLVIFADNRHQLPPMAMEDQDWGGEEGGPGADGERKELGDAAKASGGGGGGGGGSTAAPLAVQPKIGYSNHLYHHPFHSQFKYVRPGATPIPAPVPPGGTPGQARPPITMGIVTGRGRGDWRPPGVKGASPMQKGPHPGYGVPVWGANAAGRGYGSGLDFTLPSHKTIFEVDIDSFEEKPWRLPGIDVSDFFNFGMNEESWKEYCKQLEQLRLETTMQSKIRVYESGRAEQDYDPDLPPELAAAVGIQDVPSENANAGRVDGGAMDLARGSARGRPPIQPIGRPIPVETGSGERIPSVDTRRPRMQDSDSIIVIVCQSSTDDDDMTEQQDDDQVEDINTDNQLEDVDRNHRFSHAYNAQKREPVAKREQLKTSISHDEIGREDDLHVISEAPKKYHPDREIGLPREDRSAKGRGHPKSPKITSSSNSGEKQLIDHQNESFDSESGKQNPRSLPGSDGEDAVAVMDDVNNASVVDDRSFDTERENMALGATNSDAVEDGKLEHSTKPFQEIDDDREDSKGTRSSENSKARSGSSKDYRKSHDTVEDEILQSRHHPRAGNSKRPVGDDDISRTRNRHVRDESRKHMAAKDKEDIHSHRGGDLNSSLHRHLKSDSAEWRKDSDIIEGSWRRRDEDRHGRRTRVEDTRKREHGGDMSSRNRGKARESERGDRDEHYQSRNQLDSGSLRGSSHDQGIGSRQRDRGDNLKTRVEKVDDLQNKRRREGGYVNREHTEKEEAAYSHRESSIRRKRERDDIPDQRKTDDYAKLKDEDMRYVRQKEEGSLQKERGDRQRDRDEWHRHKQPHEETLPRREREETRPVMRGGRPVEDKTWTSHSRGKDDYKGSGRDYHLKDVGRHSDQLKRRDRVENESFSQHKGHEDVYERGNQGNNDEKRARYERLGTVDERVIYGSDTSRQHERRQKEGSRQRESESQDPNSLISSKRTEDEYSVQISETANTRGRTERGSGENNNHANRHSSRKHGEEASSDDEANGSKRGRSKLERWTSHKERDFGVAPISSSSLKKSKDVDTYNNSGASLVTRNPEEPSDKVEGNPHPSVDNKDAGGGETDNANTKAVEDKHLDTVEKLKKRSERFKLPMPSEKEAVVIKKMESEPLPSVQTENRPDAEIKSERPPRKRRWTGN